MDGQEQHRVTCDSTSVLSVCLLQRQVDPLPHSLTEPPPNPVLVEDVYTSTSKDHHRHQPMGTLLDHPVHKKAPGHWNVHYNWQMASKVGIHPCPLSHGTIPSRQLKSYNHFHFGVVHNSST